MERVLAIGLDGYEQSYAEQLMDAGLLPTLAARRADAAEVRLRHGRAQRTGLGWEHFWSGLSPTAAGRATAVDFDPRTYSVWQEGAQFAPFFADLGGSAVVFDTPYADFARAPQVRGVVAWGAHDPGITGGPYGSPPELVAELEAIAGPYPATRWTYAVPWASPELCREMGRDLEAGLDARGVAARWLLGERMRDWDLAVVVTSELHSGTEGLWHGVDPDHPLYAHPSAPAAGDALRALYRATDRFVADLVDATDASAVVVFAMGGMGPNGADVPSMMLLPELLFRWSLGETLLVVPEEWSAAPGCVPGLAGGPSTWQAEWYPCLANPPSASGPRRGLRSHVPLPVKRLAHRVGLVRPPAPPPTPPPGSLDLGWQPASRYRPWWPEMRAFALPSFYDGRIRLNLRGREARGVVDPADYGAVLDEIEAVLRACVNPRTGAPAVADVERNAPGDPLALGRSDADLAVVWNGNTNAFVHPTLGVVGPVPHRRPGGHTGPYGFASVTAPGVVPGDHGVASSFDVAPTILDLLGQEHRDPVSGTSLLGRLRLAPPESLARGGVLS